MEKSSTTGGSGPHQSQVVSYRSSGRVPRSPRHGKPNLYEAAFDSAREAVFITDETSRFVAVNRAAAALTGYTQEELLGLHLIDLGTLTGSATWPQWRDRIGTDGETIERARIRRKDGVGVEVELHGRGLRACEQAYIQITVRPASQRETLPADAAADEIDLRTQYARAARIARLGHWQRSSAEDTAIWSAETYEIFGVDPQHFRPSFECFLSLVHPDDRKPLAEAVQAALAGRAPLDVEYRIIRPGGEERYIHSLAEICEEADACPVRLIGTLQDVTERRRAEQRTETLASAAIELVELSPESDLFEFIGRKVLALIGRGVVSVNSIEGCTLTIRHVAGAEKGLLKLAEKRLGRTVIDMPVDHVHDQARNALRTGKLQQVEGGLHELFFHNVPRPVCWVLEKAIGLKACHSIGLRQGDRLLGNVTILSREGTVLDPGVIETFVNQASFALERRQAREALQESEERFRLFYEQSPLGYQSLDAEGRFLDVNPAWREMLGYAKEEVLGRSFADFVAPEARQGFPQRFSCFKAKGRVDAADWKMVCQDGRTIWVELDGRASYDEQGQFVQSHCVLRDVTERRRAEQALRESEERFKTLYESVQAGVIVQRADGAITHVNHTACDILGLCTDEVRARTSLDPDWQMVLEDGAPVAGEDHPSMITLRTGLPVRNAVRGLFAGDRARLRWLLINTAVLRRDHRGTVQEVLITFQDITTLKRAQREVETAHHFLEKVLNSFPGNVAVVDSDGCISRTNDAWGAFGQANGLPPRFLNRGINYLQTCRQAQGPWSEGAAEVAAALEAILAGQRHYYEAEYPCHSPDQRRWFDLQIQGFSYLGRRWAVLAHLNVTERRQAENALRESEQKYRTVVENAREGILVLQGDRRVYVNPRWLAIAGYSTAEYQTVPFMSLIHPEDHERVAQAYDDLIAGRDFAEVLEFRILNRSGETRWVHSKTTRIEWEGESAAMVFLEDVTERRQAVEALEESELKFRLVTDTIKDVFWMSTCGVGEMIYISPAYETLWERPRQRLYQNPVSFLEAIHPDDRAILLEIVDKYHAQGKPYECQYRIVQASGDVRWIFERGYPVSHSWRGARLMAGVCTDITERKRAEEALLWESSLRETLLDSIPNCYAMILKRDTHEIIASNRAAMEIGAVPGQTCYQMCARRDDFCRFCLAPELSRIGETRQTEVEYRGAWFEGIWVLLSENSYVHYIFDITQRKTAETALIDSEHRYRRLFELSPESVSVMDSQGRIVDGNRRLCEWTGYDRKELLGKEPFDLDMLDESERARVRDNFLCRSRGERVEPYEVACRTKSGETRIARVLGTPFFDEQGGFIESLLILQDVTELRRTEQALRASQDLLSRTGDTARVGGWEMDLTTQTMIWTPTTCLIAEVPDEHRPSLEETIRFFPGPTGQAVREAVEAAIAKGQPYDLELPFVTARNNQLWVRCIGHPEMEDGRCIRLSGTIQDITDRKRAQEALEESQAQLRAIFDHSLNAIVVVDDEGRYRAANAAAAELFGYPLEQLLTMNADDLQTKTSLEAEAHHRRYLEEGRDVGDFSFTRRDGQIRVAACHAVRIRDDFNLSILSDVTERRQAELKLREHERMLKATGQMARIGGWEHDLRTGKAVWTEPLHDIVGIGHDQEPPGVHEHLSYYPSPDREILERAYHRAVTEGVSFDLELRVHTATGAPIWCRVQGEPVHEHGTCVKLRGIFQDITKRREAEGRVQAYQQRLRALAAELALASERERRRIALGLHDHIGQRLAMTKLSLQSLSEGCEEATAVTLGRICAAVDELIEETRSLSFGLSNSVLYEVGLKEALESFLIKEIRPEHELAYQVEARGDLSALDNDLRCILYRNVRELVINVVKHAQARHVRVDVDMARDQITVRVEDDGLGFDLVAAEAGRLKDGHLGLFSVREYVEALGGSLKIASKPDHGTCVTLKVPIHYAERE